MNVSPTKYIQTDNYITIRDGHFQNQYTYYYIISDCTVLKVDLSTNNILSSYQAQSPLIYVTECHFKDYGYCLLGLMERSCVIWSRDLCDHVVTFPFSMKMVYPLSEGVIFQRDVTESVNDNINSSEFPIYFVLTSPFDDLCVLLRTVSNKRRSSSMLKEMYSNDEEYDVFLDPDVILIDSYPLFNMLLLYHQQRKEFLIDHVWYKTIKHQYDATQLKCSTTMKSDTIQKDNNMKNIYSILYSNTNESATKRISMNSIISKSHHFNVYLQPIHILPNTMISSYSTIFQFHSSIDPFLQKSTLLLSHNYQLYLYHQHHIHLVFSSYIAPSNIQQSFLHFKETNSIVEKSHSLLSKNHLIVTITFPQQSSCYLCPFSALLPKQLLTPLAMKLLYSYDVKSVTPYINTELKLYQAFDLHQSSSLSIHSLIPPETIFSTNVYLLSPFLLGLNSASELVLYFNKHLIYTTSLTREKELVTFDVLSFQSFFQHVLYKQSNEFKTGLLAQSKSNPSTTQDKIYYDFLNESDDELTGSHNHSFQENHVPPPTTEEKSQEDSDMEIDSESSSMDSLLHPSASEEDADMDISSYQTTQSSFCSEPQKERMSILSNQSIPRRTTIFSMNEIKRLSSIKKTDRNSLSIPPTLSEPRVSLNSTHYLNSMNDSSLSISIQNQENNTNEQYLLQSFYLSYKHAQKTKNNESKQSILLPSFSFIFFADQHYLMCMSEQNHNLIQFTIHCPMMNDLYYSFFLYYLMPYLPLQSILVFFQQFFQYPFQFHSLMDLLFFFFPTNSIVFSTFFCCYFIDQNFTVSEELFFF